MSQRLRQLVFAWLFASLSSCAGSKVGSVEPGDAATQKSAESETDAESEEYDYDYDYDEAEPEEDLLDWQSHSKTLLPVTSEDPMWGDPLAPVTIVEFSDFECPFCARVQATLQQLKERYGRDQIRIVWKHNPLPFHKNAEPAHLASIAAHQLGGNDAFWQFHNLAFENRSGLTQENFSRWAVSLGLRAGLFAVAVESPETATKLDQDKQLARKIGATGTPNFRINGVSVSGAQPLEKFVEVIDAQLEKARALAERGVPATQIYPKLVDDQLEEAPAPTAERTPPPPDLTVWKIPVYPDDPKRGGRAPLVTIVEFSDFQCPFCKRVNPTLERVLQEYGDDVQIVWKDNPLGFHPRAVPAARLARTAYQSLGDAGFWKVHDALFLSQPALEDADLIRIGRDAGLSEWRAKQALTTTTHEKKMDQSADLSQDFNARGTPHFFVNGVRVKGAQPFHEFKRVIDEQLAKANALLANGVPRTQIYAVTMKGAQAPPPPATKNVGPPPADAPSRGNPKARVVIQVFSDFQCPFCSRVEPTLDEVLQKHGRDVRIVWRHLPLPFHKDAPLAAEAAIEVYRQKGDTAFWKYHEKLFAGQKSPGLSRQNLEQYAVEIGGIDLDEFQAALDTRRHKARVEADIEVARKAGISGTPASVVNTTFVSGAQPYGAFRKAIHQALKTP